MAEVYRVYGKKWTLLKFKNIFLVYEKRRNPEEIGWND
jgi:hypothetical protein